MNWRFNCPVSGLCALINRVNSIKIFYSWPYFLRETISDVHLHFLMFQKNCKRLNFTGCLSGKLYRYLQITVNFWLRNNFSTLRSWFKKNDILKMSFLFLVKCFFRSRWKAINSSRNRNHFLPKQFFPLSFSVQPHYHIVSHHTSVLRRKKPIFLLSGYKRHPSGNVTVGFSRHTQICFKYNVTEFFFKKKLAHFKVPPYQTFSKTDVSLRCRR